MRSALTVALSALAVGGQARALHAQSASEQIRAARAQLGVRHLDSASAILRVVLSSQQSTALDRAEAHIWLGVASFYSAQDSAASLHFRAALTEDVLLAPDDLASLDSALASLWEDEQRIALCGAPVPVWGLRSRALHKSAVGLDPPEIRSGPPIPYPPLLRDAGVQGRVLVRMIVDRAGRTEPNSIRILESVDPGFNRVVTEYFVEAEFTPARSSDGAVRACVVIPVDFKMRSRR